MTIKDNDFVEIDFTGKVKDAGEVFDTTEEKVAKKNGLTENAEYRPAVVCIGRGYIFEKIEDRIKKSNIGKDFRVELSPEEAFGKKDAKLIQTLPTSAFRKKGITPKVGLQVQVNERFGVIRTINGGRCMVDFNHPLSGKDLVYNVKIRKKITDKKEKVRNIVKTELRVDDFELEEKEKDIVVRFKGKIKKLLNDKMQKVLKEKIKEITGITVKIK